MRYRSSGWIGSRQHERVLSRWIYIGLEHVANSLELLVKVLAALDCECALRKQICGIAFLISDIPELFYWREIYGLMANSPISEELGPLLRNGAC
jgi:hypothetical protein